VYKKVRDLMPKYVVTPVAHGFCMLIRRSCIKEFGLFDPIFGKGYGEETDFSMRIKSHGYITVLSNWAYVFHMEARSFSMETKSKLLEKNQLIMFKRYPLYRETVRRYVSDERDVIDRFADLIAGYGDIKNLVDLRGLSNVPEQQQKQALKAAKDFVKTSGKKVLYLVDDALAQDTKKTKLPTTSIIRQSHVKDTYHTAYRPFELTGPDQAFLLNRHALNIVIEGSDPDLVETSEKLTSGTDALKKINPAALRERWAYFTALENSSVKNHHRTSTRERAKDLIKSNRVAHSIARRIKRVLRR
jgi:cellulose synthase/poly-beta-1,6-N-acetylglucosamine synthase-like glycosyltransferase